MAELFFAGQTSQTIDIFVPDSSSTTGGGLSGLVFNSASLTCYYRKGATGSATSISLATQTVGGAWSSGGFVEIDATNMKGLYRFDIPNVVIDTAGISYLCFRGATNMAPVFVRVDCRANSVNTVQVGGTTQTAGDLAALITTVDTVVDGIQTDLDNGTDGLGAIKTDTAATQTLAAGATGFAAIFAAIKRFITGAT